MPTKRYGKSILAGRHPKSFKHADLNANLYQRIKDSNNRATAVKQGTRLRALVDDELLILSPPFISPLDSKTTSKMKPLDHHLSFTSDPAHASSSSFSSSLPSQSPSPSPSPRHSWKKTRLKAINININMKSNIRSNSSLNTKLPLAPIFAALDVNVVADVVAIAATEAKTDSEAGPVADADNTDFTKKKRVTVLSSELSTQPNKPLHFGMEISLEMHPNASPDCTTSSFLGCTYPDGDTVIKPEGSFRSGTGEFRGGFSVDADFGPTDVCIFKVVDLNDMKSSRNLHYGEGFWLRVCGGREEGTGPRGASWAQRRTTPSPFRLSSSTVRLTFSMLTRTTWVI